MSLVLRAGRILNGRDAFTGSAELDGLKSMRVPLKLGIKYSLASATRKEPQWERSLVGEAPIPRSRFVPLTWTSVNVPLRRTSSEKVRPSLTGR